MFCVYKRTVLNIDWYEHFIISTTRTTAWICEVSRSWSKIDLEDYRVCRIWKSCCPVALNLHMKQITADVQNLFFLLDKFLVPWTQGTTIFRILHAQSTSTFKSLHKFDTNIDNKEFRQFQTFKILRLLATTWLF